MLTKESSYDPQATSLNFIDTIISAFRCISRIGSKLVQIFFIVLLVFLIGLLLFFHFTLVSNKNINTQENFGGLGESLKSSPFACERFNFKIEPKCGQVCPIDTKIAFISGIINVASLQILLVYSYICRESKKGPKKSRSFFAWNHFKDPSIDLNIVYNREKQQERFPVTDIQFTDFPYYNRGHLHPKSASCYPAETYIYHNVIPQLEKANSGNWATVEQYMLDSLPIRYRNSLKICTGTYENLIINGNIYYLGANKNNSTVKKIPVPRVICKFIHSPEDKKGIVFILLNFSKELKQENPEPFSEFSLRNEELGEMPKDWSAENWNKGYCFAISPQNFLNNATCVIRQELEGWDVSNGLLIIEKEEEINKNKTTNNMNNILMRIISILMIILLLCYHNW